MSEDIKEIEMYAYIADGKKLWTSNLMFAQIRAKHYGTNNIYIESTTVEETKN